MRVGQLRQLFDGIDQAVRKRRRRADDNDRVVGNRLFRGSNVCPKVVSDGTVDDIDAEVLRRLVDTISDSNFMTLGQRSACKGFDWELMA